MSDRPPAAAAPDLRFVKWGGSLITDKKRPATAHPQVIRRLARELVDLMGAGGSGVVLGHGSGSFGHSAAHRHGVAEGITARSRLAGVSRTQDQAARLHRMVIDALIEAGAAPFSVAPGSAVVADNGRLVISSWEVVRQALDLGLLPVVFGDVVLDRSRGSAILSTEEVFVDLARELVVGGSRPPRVFWLGDTPGVLDGDGRVLGRIRPRDLDSLAAVVGGSAGTDVTGGMRHRLAGALDLLELGAESWIVDGRVAGVVGRIEGGELLGTRVCADED